MYNIDKSLEVASVNTTLSDKLKKEWIDIHENLNIGDEVFTKMYNKRISCIIANVNENNYILRVTKSESTKEKRFYKGDVLSVKKDEVVIDKFHRIGHNPFDDYFMHPKNINFPLDNILHVVFDRDDPIVYNDFLIKLNANLNPYVFIGEKQYFYQRGYVWNLEDKQKLINTILNKNSAGIVVVRKRSFGNAYDIINSYKDGNNKYKFDDKPDVHLLDIVDGKQRLSAIKEFVDNKFPTLDGVYFNDFSFVSKRQFEGSQSLGFFEFPESARDIDIMHSFLNVNNAGVPQDKKHLNEVRKAFEELNNQNKK